MKPDEIIVVDDCSTDSTGEVLDSYGEKITVISLSRNAGPSTARNKGVEKASSPWIAFLDSDDRWEKKKLERQRDYLMQNPFYQILQSEEQWIRRGKRVNPCNHHTKPEGWVFLPSLERCLISPSSVMLRKSLFERFNGFDEGLPVCEDYDLWLRIARHFPVGLEPGLSVVKYGGHQDQLSLKYPAMDSFRVQALTALLKNEVDHCIKDRISGVLSQKLDILIKGCEKRHKTDCVEHYREILQSL